MTWSLALGDCLDPSTGLASLADRSIDHVITDPPYDEHTHTRGRRGAMRSTDANTCRPRRRVSEGRELGFAAITPSQMEAASRLFGRLARRWVLVFCALEMTADWRQALELGGLEYIRCGLWRKLGSTPQFTGDRPAVGAEAIVIAHPRGRKRWNGGGRHGVWDAPIVLDRTGRDPRLHTTQKPLSLLSALVADFTNREDTILDPFSGSGTTGVAAIRAGRHFVGWELDSKYHATASARLAETREQASLLGARPPKSEQLALLGK